MHFSKKRFKIASINSFIVHYDLIFSQENFEIMQRIFYNRNQEHIQKLLDDGIYPLLNTRFTGF